MNKNLIPDITVKSIDELDAGFFISHGIKAVFLDIDNTLVVPHAPLPDERAEKFVRSLINAGLTVCFISNNKKERVDKFNTFGVQAIHRAAKPFTYSYRLMIKKLGIKADEAAAVGDQFFSDIYGANRAGLLTVYVNPIKIGGEGAFVWLKRKLEAPLLKKLRSGNYIKIV